MNKAAYAERARLIVDIPEFKMCYVHFFHNAVSYDAIELLRMQLIGSQGKKTTLFISHACSFAHYVPFLYVTRTY